MTRRSLGKLHDLAVIARDAELAKMQKIIAHMNRLQAEITAIQTAREARAANRELDPALLSGADVQWMVWSDGQLRRLQSQLAAIRVNYEVMLASVRTAFGKAETLSKLSQKATSDDRLQARRRTLG